MKQIDPAAGILVYVGTYTQGRREGIYVFRMDPASGALTRASAAGGVENPSFLALHPQQRYLYAISEVNEFGGRKSGAVSAFSLDPETGDLVLLNQQPSGGAGPCYVSVEKTGRFVMVAHYGAGSVSLLPLTEGGRLGEPSDVVQHQGSSANPSRQEAPHAHSIVPDPQGRFTLAADLGLDKVFVYRLDKRRRKLAPNDPPAASVHAGAGPRHIVFAPGGRHVYVINELDSTLTAFAYDAVRGALREVQTVSTLPVGFRGSNSCADIHMSLSGKFLYGSNRGHDSIAIFAVDKKAGTLRPVGHEPTGGKTPRNFGIDPGGRFLLAANQDTDTIVTFRLDERTGWPTPTGHVTSVPRPVCVTMISS